MDTSINRIGVADINDFCVGARSGAVMDFVTGQALFIVKVKDYRYQL